MINYLPSLLVLFLLSLLTSTPIPIPLDLVIVGSIKLGVNPIYAILFAMAGLILAATFDYLIGKFGIQYIPFFKKSKKNKRFKQAKKIYAHYGQWTLLFTFTPFIGKYFPFLAGVMDLPFINFFLILIIGKLVYYGFLLLLLTPIR